MQTDVQASPTLFALISNIAFHVAAHRYVRAGVNWPWSPAQI